MASYIKITFAIFGFRKMDKPMSRTAAEIMQRADPSCKIWFVCKGQLICTRDKEVKIAPAVTPLLQASDHLALQLSPLPEEDEVESELDFYDVLKEACIAGEDLMKRALNESSRRQKADEELASALQKATEYQELYSDEAKRREELEEALVRANIEIAQLRQANHLPTSHQSSTTVELQDEMAEKPILEQCIVDMKNTGLGAEGQLIIEPHKEDAQIRVDRGNGARELQALLDQSRLAAFSPSSVIQSPYDEDSIPAHFICPILQEVMRDPHVAADGFTYEGDAIRGWLLDGGRRAVSLVTGQPLAHRELTQNLALPAVIQDYMTRRRSSVDSHDVTVL